MSIGNKISNLILTNLEIWHSATRIKDSDGNIRHDHLAPKELVEVHHNTRIHNANRSRIRYSIDIAIDSDALNEIKIDYLSGE